MKKKLMSGDEEEPAEGGEETKDGDESKEKEGSKEKEEEPMEEAMSSPRTSRRATAATEPAATAAADLAPSVPTGVRIDQSRVIAWHTDLVRLTEGFVVEKLERIYTAMAKVSWWLVTCLVTVVWPVV